MSYKSHLLKEYCPSKDWINQKKRDWENRFPNSEADPYLSEIENERNVIASIDENTWEFLFYQGYVFDSTKDQGKTILLRKVKNDEIVPLRDVIRKEGEIA
jgi:hypothetical protein